jgi:hypothetical protein
VLASERIFGPRKFPFVACITNATSRFNPQSATPFYQRKTSLSTLLHNFLTNFANKKTTTASSKEEWGIGAVATTIQETEKKSPKKAIIIAATIAALLVSAAALVYGILNYEFSAVPAGEKTTTESTTMSCSGHNYCSAQTNGTCTSCSKPSNSGWASTSGCGWNCNSGYYKSGNNCKLSLYAYKRRVGVCVDHRNNTYSSVVTYTYIGEANDGFNKTLDTEWRSDRDYYQIVYDFSTNYLGDRSVTLSCSQYETDQFPRSYDPSKHNGGLNFVDTDSYFYKSKSGGLNVYTTFTRK